MKSKRDNRTNVKTINKHLTEIDIAIVAEPSEAGVKFTVYEIESYIMPQMIPQFHKAGSTCYPCPVTDRRDADVFIEGHVKFDGCSNWNFPNLKSCWIHCCSRQELNKISVTMQTCWDMAKELLGESFCGF